MVEHGDRVSPSIEVVGPAHTKVDSMRATHRSGSSSVQSVDGVNEKPTYTTSLANRQDRR